MQIVILSLFCPILVAIAVRIVLWIIGFILALGGSILNAGRGFMEFTESIALFDTFVWDESWGYWAIVAIITFIGEMVIWEEN